MKKFYLDKEHFDIEPVDAVLYVFKALNRREPIFYDRKIEAEFNEALKKSKEEMSKRLGNSHNK